MAIGRVQASLLVQVIQSAIAFVIALSLIPPLGPLEYGVFTLGVSLQMAALSIVDSLLTVPITVASGRYGTRVAGKYVTTLLPAVLGFSVIASAAIVAAVFAGASALDVPAHERIVFSLVVGAGTLAVSLRETIRMLLLVERRLLFLISVDIAAAVTNLLALVVCVGPAREYLNGSIALLTLVAPIVVYVLALGFLLDHPVRLRHTGLIFQLARRGGKSLGASTLNWLQSQSYIYFVATFLGATALGSLSAVRVVFAPLQTLFTGIAKGVTPGLARRVSTGDIRSVFGALRRSYGIFIGIVLLWTVLAIFGADDLFSAIGARHFQFDRVLIASWGAVFLFTALRSISSVGLRAMARFDDLLKQGMVGALVAAVSIPSLILKAGAVGALWGLALAEFAAFLFSLRSLSRVK